MTRSSWILAAKRDVSRSTGTDQIPFDHYEKMPLLIALIKVYHSSMNIGDSERTFWCKETLRMHPVVFMTSRQAAEDEVIPLSQPLKLSNGRKIAEIPISRGQNIWINTSCYNRLPSIFGENAHEFNIDRWLDNRLDDLPGLVGVYSILMSFGHGPHTCIGEHLPFHPFCNMGA